MGQKALKLTLAELERRLDAPPVPPEDEFRPWHVRVAPEEQAKLLSIGERHHLRVVDNIERQLDELQAVRKDALGSRESWVYFPWDAKIVHVLSAEDYFDVITSRNQNKITRQEQELLRTRRVGVVGLSVGSEAAVSVAQEHLCGHMVLADFDRLDLSNLNRINAGVDDLGENKARIAARRIAKIDPYLELTLFEHGVNDENIDQFMAGLDLLIEECDDLQAKRDVRLYAREHGVNIIYGADERGFLSVEPYRDFPELELFHGRIDGPQPPRDAFETPLAFMKALTEWLGGWGNISKRSQKSLELLGESLCGYPQLASEARYAAGQLGHVARRLLLGEKLPPYLGNLDLEELVPSA